MFHRDSLRSATSLAAALDRAHGAARLGTFALLLLALGACATTPDIGAPYDEPEPRPVENREILWPGDSIEIEYSRVTAQVESYRLGVGDALEIEVFRHPELALETSVGPDGTIAFHQVGSLLAAGSTVEELRAKLTQSLVAQYPDPSVSIFLKQSDTHVERFLQLLLTHPSGAMREVRIANDGRVSLPGVGTVELAGRTAAEAQALLNERLQSVMPSLSVYLSPKRQAGLVFSVLGEVAKPGRYPLDTDCSLIEALAIAGGGTAVADLERVVVMGFPAPGQPAVAHVYDLKTALDRGRAMSGVQIRPRDTVLVLRSGVGDVNAAIDQYIRRNLPFNLNLTYRLDQ